MSLSYVGKGVYLSGFGTMFVPAPTGLQANDLLLLRIETKNENHHSPAGWTKHWLTPLGSGGSGASRIYLFYKFTSGSESLLHLPDDFTHRVCSLVALRGVWTGMPFKRDWVGFDRFNAVPIMKWLEATVDNKIGLVGRRTASMVTSILPIPTPFVFTAPINTATLVHGGGADAKRSFRIEYAPSGGLHLGEVLKRRPVYLPNGGMNASGSALLQKSITLGGTAASLQAMGTASVSFRHGAAVTYATSGGMKFSGERTAKRWVARLAGNVGMLFGGGDSYLKMKVREYTGSGGLSLVPTTVISRQRTCKLVLSGSANSWVKSAGSSVVGKCTPYGGMLMGGSADMLLVAPGFRWKASNQGMHTGGHALVLKTIQGIIDIRFKGTAHVLARLVHRNPAKLVAAGSAVTSATHSFRQYRYLSNGGMKLPFTSTIHSFNDFVKINHIGTGFAHLDGSAITGVFPRQGLYIYGGANTGRTIQRESLCALSFGGHGFSAAVRLVVPIVIDDGEPIYTTTGVIEEIIVGNNG